MKTMKAYLLFVWLILCTSACDNAKSKGGAKGEKEEIEKVDRTDTEEDETGDLKWTKSQKSTSIKDCMKSEEKKSAGYDEDKARQSCSCMVDIMAANISYDEYQVMMESGSKTEDRVLQKKINRIKSKMKSCASDDETEETSTNNDN